MDTATAYVVDYPGEDAGKTCRGWERKLIGLTQPVSVGSAVLMSPHGSNLEEQS